MRERRIETAFKRIRERTAAGVEAQDWNALVAEAIAASISLCEAEWMFASGSRVDGSIDWNTGPEAGWILPS